MKRKVYFVLLPMGVDSGIGKNKSDYLWVSSPSRLSVEKLVDYLFGLDAESTFVGEGVKEDSLYAKELCNNLDIVIDDDEKHAYASHPSTVFNLEAM